MVQRAEIVDPFYRELFDVIAPEIDKRMVNLASGAAKQIEGSVTTTAESYAAEVATIAAYNEVLKLCEQIQANRHGPKPATESTTSQE